MMKPSKEVQIVLFYALFAGLWILLSDQLLAMVARPFPPVMLTYLQTIKGGLFVAATAAMLYFLLRKEVQRLKSAQCQLEQSQAIVNASPMIVCLWRNEPGWPVEMVSHNVMDTFGYSASELTSGRIRYVDLVHPDDLQRIIAEIVTNVRDLKGDAFSQEYRIVARDGRVKWIEDRTLVRRNAQGRISHFQGIVFDVTDKKLAEEELRRQKELLQTIMDNIPLMVVFNGTDGHIQWVNRTWEKTLGWPLAEARDTDIMQKLYPDSEQLDAVNDFIRRADGRWEHFKTHTRNGEVLDTSWINIVLSDGTNIGIGQDVSELKEEERKRKKLEFQLHQAQKMESVGRLAAGVAHDFNNLLSIIIGYAELNASNYAPGDPRREPLQQILDAADRAKILTRQLLAFGRKQMLSVEVFDLNDTIRSFESMVRRLLGEDIAIELFLCQAPCTVRADISQIEQVLMNLVVNARDAMPDGGRLTIETEIRAIDADYAAGKPEVEPGTYVMIAISDTGKGMDRTTAASIFEPFFTTRAAEGGSGLGLSTVYGIVKQHRGNIWVYSEPGRGTTFKIYLPHLDAPAATIPKPAPAAQPPARITATVLVVEDDPTVRELACTILEGLGAEVISSQNVADAIRIAETLDKPLDLLLTDVVMPGMKGPEVYHRIARFQPQAKALFMSGYTENVIFKQGILQDGFHFIQKPFTIRSLHEKIGQVLAG